MAASESFTSDRLWLNGVEVEINGRGVAVLREIRSIAGDRVDSAGTVIVKKSDWPKYKVHISSVNTFPTGAGLASSAAGLACMTATLAKLYCCQETFPGQLTAIARQGSGSASRSLYGSGAFSLSVFDTHTDHVSLEGGLVRWQKGVLANATDSIAIQVADENVNIYIQKTFTSYITFCTAL